MADKLVTTPYDHLTYETIGCAMAAHRELGPGLRENSYQRAMEARLAEAGVEFEAQKLLEVFDNGILVGYYIPDFMIANAFPVEIKALWRLDNTCLRQIIGLRGRHRRAAGSADQLRPAQPGIPPYLPAQGRDRTSRQPAVAGCA